MHVDSHTGDGGPTIEEMLLKEARKAVENFSMFPPAKPMYRREVTRQGGGAVGLEPLQRDPHLPLRLPQPLIDEDALAERIADKVMKRLEKQNKPKAKFTGFKGWWM